MNRLAALEAASSTAWESRANAATVLARSDDNQAATAVRMLLADADLGIVQRAAASLLGHGTKQAMLSFTAAYAAADDQRGDVMNDELRSAVAMDPELLVTLEALAAADDAGAKTALAWLG